MKNKHWFVLGIGFLLTALILCVPIVLEYTPEEEIGTSISGLFIKENTKKDFPVYNTISPTLKGVESENVNQEWEGNADLTLVKNYCTGPVNCEAEFTLTPMRDRSLNKELFTLDSYLSKGRIGDLKIYEKVCFEEPVMVLVSTCDPYTEKVYSAENDTYYDMEVGNCTHKYEQQGTEELCDLVDIGSTVSFKEDEERTYVVKGKVNPNTVMDWRLNLDGFEPEWAWWDSSYTYRKEVMVSGSNISLTNFTVYLNITYSSNMQSGFDDIRFLNGSCTNNSASSWENWFEFDRIVNDSSAGIWVLVPNLTAGVNEMCMYYGKSDATRGDNPTLAWDSSYTGVFHFNEGSGVETKNSIDGIVSGLVGSPIWANNASCGYGNCLSFDKADDCVVVENNANIFDTGELTVSMIHDPRVTNGHLLSKRYKDGAWANPYTAWILQGNGNYGCAFSDGAELDCGYVGTSTSAKGFISINYEETGGTGVQIQNITVHDTWAFGAGSLTSEAAGLNISFGCSLPSNTPTYFGDGIMDEVKISGVKRVASWLAREYYNINTSTYVFGSEVQTNIAPTAPVWSYPGSNGTVVIDATYVANWTNSTDANGDTITYYLDVSVDDDFSTFLYTNASISETATPTGDILSGLTVGTIYARVLASDGTVNSSWSSIYWTQQSTNVTVSLSVPADTANSTTASVVFNCSAYDPDDTISNLTLILDDVANYSVSGSANNLSLQYNASLSDSIHTWTCNATTELNEFGTADKRNFTIDPVDMDLNIPSVDANFTHSDIEFNCTANSTADILNITLVLDGVHNYTLSVSGPNKTISLKTNVTVADGNHDWYCLAHDINLFNASAGTRSFGVDSVLPFVEVSEINGSFVTTYLPINTTLNWTASDSNIIGTWIDYNGANHTGVNNGSTYGYGVSMAMDYRGVNSFYIYSNDTYGQVNRTPVNITVFLLNETTNYTGLLYSLTANTFNLTIDTTGELLSGVRASFTHNGTNWTVTETAVTANITRFLSTPIMPIVASLTNKTFFWDVIMTQTNGTDFPTYRYTYQSEVAPINFSQCAGAGGSQVILMNFTNLNELNKSVLPTDFDGYFTLWQEDADNNYSISISVDNVNHTYICVDNSSNATFYTSAQIQYVTSGYDLRNWFIRNVSLDVDIAPINTLFYSLVDADGTGTQFIVTDDSESPLADRIIHVERKDISNDDFFAVAMGKTDSEGHTYIPVQYHDAWYRFLVYDELELEYITSETIIQTSPLYIRVGADSIVDQMYNFDNMDVALSFNNDTHTFTLEYANAGGTIQEVCMDVMRSSHYVSNTTECKKCGTAASGTLTCVVGDKQGIYTAVVYAKQNPNKNLLTLTWENISSIGQTLGLAGIAYSLLLLVSIVFMFIFSPTTAVLATLLSMVVIFAFGIGSMPFVALSSLVCVGIVILVVIRS